MNRSSCSRKAVPLRRTALYAVLLASLPGSAWAVELDYQVGASLLHSDNINLSDEMPLSETVLMPQLRFTAEQNGAAVQLKARGSVQYLDYRKGVYDNEVRGDFNGQLNWIVLPERMNFIAENYLSQQPISTLTGFSQGNSQQVNVFVTGPSFFARFGDRTLGQLDLRYSNTYAEEINTFDGDRYSAAGRINHDLSSTQHLSFNAETTKVEFDRVASASNYRRHDAYVGYLSNMQAMDLDVSAGYSRLELSEGGPSSSEPLIRTKLDWRLSPRHILRGVLNYEFADVTQNLVNRIDNPQGPIIGGPVPPGQENVQIGPDTFRQTHVEVGYLYRGETFNARLQPYRDRVRYLDGAVQDQDQNVDGMLLEAGYRLSPGMSLTLLAVREKREFTGVTRNDRDSVASLAFTNQFSRHWQGRAEVQYRKRDSSTPAQDYVENAVVLSFHYSR